MTTEREKREKRLLEACRAGYITHHSVKSHPEHFSERFAGLKTFELRYDDRGYEVGDAITECEWDPATEEYTGREIGPITVTNILRGPCHGLIDGWVILSLGSADLMADLKLLREETIAMCEQLAALEQFILHQEVCWVFAQTGPIGSPLTAMFSPLTECCTTCRSVADEMQARARPVPGSESEVGP